MIKLTSAKATATGKIALSFSDGSSGDYDLQRLIASNTVLTAPLADPLFRDRLYLELGALCWPNGLELSAASLHRELQAAGVLRKVVKAA